MSVSNELNINLNGSKDECISFILGLFKVGYLTSITVNGKLVMHTNLCRAKVYEVINEHDFSSPVKLFIFGPYGNFELFDGLNNMLSDACKEVPTVVFDGELYSIYEVDGSERFIEFSYKKKTLKYADSQYFQSHNDEMYLEYIQKKLSYKRFTTLFKLDRDEFDETMYEEIVLNDMEEGSFFEMDYDEMMELLPKSKLKEEKFDDVMGKIEELEIFSYDDYTCEVEGYEPKRKDWIKTTIKI